MTIHIRVSTILDLTMQNIEQMQWMQDMQDMQKYRVKCQVSQDRGSGMLEIRI